ncbi:hypothetical protein [Microbulbifer magnicolonia]|uniref:hypothetical protein n=1 Tax=Microbulbifer magnicolonia TaxID=3109744 RepID=UPI002B41489B|nr:hypothetical protein [Microbulbifer sp. GG15]
MEFARASIAGFAICGFVLMAGVFLNQCPRQKMQEIYEWRDEKISWGRFGGLAYGIAGINISVSALLGVR